MIAVSCAGIFSLREKFFLTAILMLFSGEPCPDFYAFSEPLTRRLPGDLL
jgi:hypothetical protein